MSERRPTRRALAAAYRWLAVNLLSALLLFVAANLVAALLLRSGLGVPEPGALAYGAERLRRLYPGMSDEEIERLLTEIWTRPYEYEAFTQFRERAFAGRYLNILEPGFRSSGRPQPWPPDPAARNVFVFGGSTAFGYGLADHQTLPARLEELLRGGACGAATTVYNLARSNYYSTQEIVLFERLAARGIAPALAIFVDGLNEFAYARDEPRFTARLSYLMSETPAQTFRRWLVNLPLARLAKGLGAGAAEPSAAGPAADPGEVVARWLRNKGLAEALASHLNVATLFVWQPVPAWGFDPARHPFADRGAAAVPPSLAAGYDELADRRRSGDPRLAAPGFLWLADAQAGREEPLYVDRVHYSARFTEDLARAIAAPAAARLCGEAPAEEAAASPPAAAPARG